MSRSRSAALAVAALLVTLTVVNLADAQERRGGRGRGGGFGGQFGGMMGSPIFLLANEKVQQELELLDDQKAEVQKTLDELRPPRGQGGPGQGGPGQGGFQQLSDEERQKLRAEREERTKAATEKVNSILLPHQAERLKEISLQVRGTAALTDDEVAKALSITDEQKQKFDTIRQESFEQMRGLFPQPGQDQPADADRQAAFQKMAELRRAAEEKTLAVLTDEQRQQFDSMQGEKFEGIDELRRPRGFGGGRGGPGGRGPGGGQRGARPAQGDE
ncbi:MAG: Spy/CpxP family protein refolding chaperone [Pirellulales bacterium]